ncbi:unnamed protein product [Phyllotreta striolata]|uniref:Carboxypeptidase n=1 Tax=Phyllotreta striolata TaxID=444603 RepID=A0A9N9TZM2_PHYSR|nr:unnamed protein product [Phyllotreta striolata]
MKLIFILLLSIPVAICLFPNVYKKIPVEAITDDPGVPLFLTPLIEQNKLQDARAAARVYFNGFKDLESYAGYFTVDKAYSSNLFFWYFPAISNASAAPVILWLQGGPGASSLIGLFGENGPFQVKSKGLKLRPYSWTNDHSVIYIDSPAGTGYSFTKGGYAQNETKVAGDLYNALVQFFTVFPELQKNDFYVSGESYGGKYVPAISYAIHQNNPNAKLKINLKGLSIGNGFCDPINQLNYADYLFQLGLIDSNGKKTFESQQQQGIDYIKNNNFAKAAEVFDDLLDGDFNNRTSTFQNLTGFANYYDFLYPYDTNEQEIDLTGKYLQRADVRAAIHVGYMPFNGISKNVALNLIDDIMRSVTPWLKELLENYRVLIYNGQLDIIVAYPMTANFLGNLDFNGADQYKTATRYKWYVGEDLAGYVKQAGNLTEVLVRDAGHMVPADQPQWALDLILRFTRNKPFH